MDEHVGASPIRGDEAISLIGVEIDYCAGLSGHPPPTIPLSGKNVKSLDKYRRRCGASSDVKPHGSAL
jgi:hypothetical protein